MVALVVVSCVKGERTVVFQDVMRRLGEGVSKVLPVGVARQSDRACVERERIGRSVCYLTTAEESPEERNLKCGRCFGIKLGERECFEIRVWEGGPVRVL